MYNTSQMHYCDTLVTLCSHITFRVENNQEDPISTPDKKIIIYTFSQSKLNPSPKGSFTIVA